MDHADLRKILVHFQHGFRKGHTCESQLINTVEELSKALNQKQQTDCIGLDFSKAFDTVAHQRLLHKLNYYGGGGSTLQWINSWLIACAQSVVVDGDISDEVHVASGVPQGTVLSPLLFLLNINDLGQGVNSTIKLFGDDCILLRQINTETDSLTLQQDLDTVVQ